MNVAAVSVNKMTSTTITTTSIKNEKNMFSHWTANWANYPLSILSIEQYATRDSKLNVANVWTINQMDMDNERAENL